jgi:hypothetical protein
MINKYITKTYYNIVYLLVFMSFNQTFIYGDLRGFILLIGLLINYVFYLILNKTSQTISNNINKDIPSLYTQFVFFYIGFQIAHYSTNYDVEMSYYRVFYFIIIGACSLFITSFAQSEDININEDTSGRILGAIIGTILGSFYYTLISYKYNITGEDKYNKSYKICKGGESYDCKIEDYDKIKDDVKQNIASVSDEVKKEKTILDDLWKYNCDSCNTTV